MYMKIMPTGWWPKNRAHFLYALQLQQILANIPTSFTSESEENL